ncbi:Uncharacterised protein [Chlamydia abortus]|nr:Uncharacterised protein [Chlamydia abortus]
MRGKIEIKDTEYRNKALFNLNGKRIVIFYATVITKKNILFRVEGAYERLPSIRFFVFCPFGLHARYTKKNKNQ